MRDIPSFDEVVVASAVIPTVAGFYPGSGPDGSGETDAPDGPFVRLSPMVFAVDSQGVPAYIEAAAREMGVSAEQLHAAVAQDPGALERDLMRELGIDESMLDQAEASLAEPDSDDIDLAEAIEVALSSSAQDGAAPSPGESTTGSGLKRSANEPRQSS